MGRGGDKQNSFKVRFSLQASCVSSGSFFPLRDDCYLEGDQESPSVYRIPY